MTGGTSAVTSMTMLAGWPWRAGGPHASNRPPALRCAGCTASPTLRPARYRSCRPLRVGGLLARAVRTLHSTRLRRAPHAMDRRVVEAARLPADARMGQGSVKSPGACQRMRLSSPSIWFARSACLSASSVWPLARYAAARLFKVVWPGGGLLVDSRSSLGVVRRLGQVALSL